MWLREQYLSVTLSINVDTKKILYISFHHNVQFGILDILDDLVNFRTSQDGIVSVEYIDYLALIKDTFIHFGLLKPNLVDKLLYQVFIPNLASLLLAVNVSVNLEYVVLAASPFNGKTFGYFHVDVPLNWCLRECQHIVDLCGVPVMY